MKESNEQIIKIGIAALVIVITLPVIVMIVSCVGLGTIQVITSVYDNYSDKSLS